MEILAFLHDFSHFDDFGINDPSPNDLEKKIYDPKKKMFHVLHQKQNINFFIYIISKYYSRVLVLALNRELVINTKKQNVFLLDLG